MKKSLIPIAFSVLVGIFALLLATFFIPGVVEFFQGPPFLVILASFFLAGLILIILTVKEKTGGSLKKFLLLTGSSAVGFFVFSFLHNLFYGLEMVSSQLPLISNLMGFFHAIFFLISIFVCPIGFVIGLFGSGIVFIKEKIK